ncbi:MAG: hypothetical protein RIE58_11410 [Vicingaceae bacterium]
MRNLLIISILIFSLSSCSSHRMIGLWQVDLIAAGSSQVEPRSSWIKFDKDEYQESGHGWQKHNTGAWKLKRKKLSINNENGYRDIYDPYEVVFKKKTMEWTRREDDQRVKMFLSKIEEVPMANRDYLLGIWNLKTVLRGGEDRSREYNPASSAYLHIKWDNRFITDRGKEGRKSGIYRVDGNRDEIELYISDVECELETWNFQLQGNKLILTSVKKEPEILLEYVRTDILPQ